MHDSAAIHKALGHLWWVTVALIAFMVNLGITLLFREHILALFPPGPVLEPSQGLKVLGLVIIGLLAVTVWVYAIKPWAVLVREIPDTAQMWRLIRATAQQALPLGHHHVPWRCGPWA